MRDEGNLIPVESDVNQLLAKDQFMLDTFTGRLWRIAESGDVGLYLRTVPYRSKGGKYVPLPEKLTDSEPEKIKKE